MATDSGGNATPEDLAARLREAEATIAALRQEQADNAFAEQLRGALVRLGVAGQLASPLAPSDLLELIVRTAAQVLTARAGALTLLDRATNEQVFEVIQTFDAQAESTAARARGQRRVPMGRGVAGWVAASGQPLARSDLANDPQFAALMRTQGAADYVPQAVLCIPLRWQDEVIGTLMVLDKASGASFTPEDMALLEQFGAAAAVAIEQSQLLGALSRLFAVILHGMLTGGSEEQALQEALGAQAVAFADRTTQTTRYHTALEITQLVGEIAREGDEARHYVIQLLTATAELFRAQARRNTVGGWQQ